MNKIPYIQTEGGIDTGETFFSAPITCDLCGQENLSTFIAGYVKPGAWVNTCQACHEKFGTGLGILRGQKYEFNSVQANELN